MGRIRLQRTRLRAGLCLWSVLALSSCASPQADAPATDAPEEDANAAIAASVPSTDIVLIALAGVLAGDERTPAKAIVRRHGYDNQPTFSADGQSIWFSSIRDGEQADVYRYALSGGITQVTDTAESEYSPTPLPSGGFSTIQVAIDGTQRLWRYDDAGEPQTAIRPDITGVGYHAWVGTEALALFIVDEPMRLEMVSLLNEARIPLSTNIGRALHFTSKGNLGYVQKDADGVGTVHELHVRTGHDTARAVLPGEGEDLVWLADGSALTANGRTIYRLQPEATKWQPLVNLAWSVHGDISRMAVDPQGEWLALVVGESER